MTFMRSCHKQVRSIAQAAAGEYYERVMSRDNVLWDAWKKRFPALTPLARERKFIALMWPKFIELARGTLAHMLSRPDISEEMKVQIYEALTLDSSLTVGRHSPQDAADIVNAELLREAKESGHVH